MIEIIGVRFKSVGKVYYFSPGDYKLVKKTGEGLGAALTGLDFSDILGQKNSKGKKNGEFLEETFFEMEYDGYRIAICGEKDSKPEFVVYRGTIDNCFL